MLTSSKRSSRIRIQALAARWCAWQESNLLPLAPQASALSGELQAREGFSLGEPRRRPPQPQSSRNKGCLPKNQQRGMILANPTPNPPRVNGGVHFLRSSRPLDPGHPDDGPDRRFRRGAAGAIQNIWFGEPAIYVPPAIPATETKFFSVSGFTQRALIDSLNTSGICTTYGPCAPDPAVPQGIAWALEGIDFIPGLFCYTPQTSPLPYRTFVLLPRWAPRVTSVTPTLVSRWDALDQVLYVHEAGHAAISNQDLAALLNQARALPSCLAVVDFWARPALFDKMEADQAAYHARLHADCRPEIGCIPANWLGW